jgi:hypothetical protein
MVRQNQGFRKDLNLEETVNEVLSLSNLGGPNLPNDLRIIQNNLRNVSIVGYVTFSDGFFSFPDNEFIFTNDDIVGVSTSVFVGSTTLVPGTEYFVCNSDGKTKFKLSTTSSTSENGINVISVSNVNPSSFNFIRKDYVLLENVVNLVEPNSLDQEFSYLGGSTPNEVFREIENNNELSEFFISQKYRSDKNFTTNDELKYEGSITINDPAGLNSSVIGLNNQNSPGVFIGTVRAFSSDNNPWTQVGTALSTSSSEVSVEELLFYDGLNVSGISTVSDTVIAATSFTHKIPIIVNGETYYLLLHT